MDSIDALLERYWGYSSFRPLQREAIDCVLARRDSLLVLPTGGGKSVCYQVPALAMDGMAVVVSPLISLMKDQVDALRVNGVEAACIHSMLSDTERREIADGIQAGRIKVLYVSPERLNTPGFLAYLKRFTLSFVAIDEAHCISHWGHDFRPDYRALRSLKDHFPDIALHGFTATATAQVRGDIVEQLGLNHAEVIVGSFDRPNLVLRARQRDDEIAQLREVVERHPGESGIVYCISRKKVDEIAANLQEAGYRARPYHAGMNDDSRRDNQDAFIREDTDIIVATVAFGMGIDKSNVRYVVHLGMPKSLEHYQQECGRAGRDGLEAECCLFYSAADGNLWRRLMQSDSEEGNRIAFEKLNHMTDFCAAVTCRHKLVVEYFGERYERDNCGACDLCLGEADLLPEALEVARKILTAVLDIGHIASPHYASLVLSGSRDDWVKDKKHDKLSVWGALSSYLPKQVRDWIEQLSSQGLVEKTGEQNVLQLTSQGEAVLNGEATPRLLQPPSKRSGAKKSRGSAQSWEGVDKGLFEHLRVLRKSVADEREVPAFVIFGDAALRDMARRRPTTLDSFIMVQGVGSKKRDDFGELFIAAIRDYCETDGLPVEIEAPPEPKPEPAPKPKSTKKPNKSTLAAFDLFEKGNSVEEVAEQMGRAHSTTYGYLERYLQERNIVDPNPWLDSEIFKQVQDAIETVGTQTLKPIYLHLNEAVPYEQIRVAVTCLRNRDFKTH